MKPWLAGVASIILHLLVVVGMHWQKRQATPLVVEAPKVSRVRILSNPDGNPRAVAKPVEVKAPPVAKPKPKPKVKPKAKPKAKSRIAAKKAKPEKVKPEAPPPPPNNAPQSFGDNKTMGLVGKGVSNTTGPSDKGADTSWMPLEQVKPNMPREAALKGIEGFITFLFDITEEGRVENIRVAQAENRSVFEQEARRAVRKFRYAPKKINGRPVRVVGHSFTIVFTLTH